MNLVHEMFVVRVAESDVQDSSYFKCVSYSKAMDKWVPSDWVFVYFELKQDDVFKLRIYIFLTNVVVKFCHELAACTTSFEDTTKSLQRGLREAMKTLAAPRVYLQ